ncbi:hypothetical protein Dimus_007244 [Dionaea muscipula]
MATATDKPSAKSLQPENPRETLVPTTADPAPHPPNPTQPNRAAGSSNPSAQPAPPPVDVSNPAATKMIGDKGSHSSAGLGLVSPTASSGSGPDIEKKVRRAERFGVPVQLSEEEKRSSRAERFGTGSGDSKAYEDNKRKARAERFGLPAHSAADEEAKKKVRFARFTAPTKVDSLEEEKRKAREMRFSQSEPKSVSLINGKGGVGLVSNVPICMKY